MLRTLVLASVSLLLIAACGGDGDDARPTPGVTAAPTSDESTLPRRPDQPVIYTVEPDGSGLRTLFAQGDFVQFAATTEGDRIAVGESSPVGQQSRLYIIDVTSGDRALAVEDEGTLAPLAWSPDGEWLAVVQYTSGGARMHLYGSETGELTPIDAALDPQLVEWSPASDAMYLASGNSPSHLVRVSVPDLDVEEFPDLQFAFEALDLSPDGESLAIGRYIEGEDEAQRGRFAGFAVSVAETDGSDRREVARLEGDTIVAGPIDWSPEGDRIAVSWVSSQEQPDGATAFRSGIYVIDVASGSITPATQSTYADAGGVDIRSRWSADGVQLLVHRHVCTQCDGSTSRQLLASADGSGEVALPGTEVMLITTSAWSPVGDRFAYGSDRLYVASGDGSDAEAIADLPNSSYGPIAWSGDGERLFFQRGPSSGPNLYAVTPDGAGLEAITAPATWIGTTVAPDGVTVAGIDEDGRILIVTPDGETIEVTGGPLTDVEPQSRFGIELSWSPDGSLLAIELGKNSGDLVVADLTGVLREVSMPGRTGPFRWSPDSTRLAYRAETAVYAVDASGDGGRIPVADATVVPLDWSPDGDRIAFIREGSVWTANADGSGGEAELFAADVGGLGAIALRWSPDGERIAAGSGSQIVVGPASGGAAEPLAAEQIIQAFEWADGDTLVYVASRTSGEVPQTTNRQGLFTIDAAAGNDAVMVVEAIGRVHELAGLLADGRIVIASSSTL